MRVIAGEFRSRRLKSLPGAETRPTPDRLRETLFDILQPHIEGVLFTDAYAGTGAVGIEALSRGAAHAVFLERNRAAVDIIRENIASLGLSGRATVIRGKVLEALTRYTAGIIFLDPPYDLESEYTGALDILADAPALIVVQHSVRQAMPDPHRALKRTQVVRQGDNALSFYASSAPHPTTLATTLAD